MSDAVRYLTKETALVAPLALKWLCNSVVLSHDGNNCCDIPRCKRGTRSHSWSTKSWHLKTILREDPFTLAVGSPVDILGCFNDPYSSLPSHPHFGRHTFPHRYTFSPHYNLSRDLICVVTADKWLSFFSLPHLSYKNIFVPTWAEQNSNCLEVRKISGDALHFIPMSGSCFSTWLAFQYHHMK